MLNYFYDRCDHSESCFSFGSIVPAYQVRESGIAILKCEIARWNAFGYSSVKVLLVIIFICVSFICVDVDKFTTGRIYSIVAYLRTFIASTDYLPELMESLGSVKDLNVRFDRDNIIE